MSHPQDADLAALIAALVDGGVEMIVVGGAAGILHGADMTTRDVDVVHRRTAENVGRLLAILEGLDAVIREPGNRGLRPDAELLLHGRRPLLSTSLGPLDTLCVLNDGRGYDELLAHSVVLVDGARRLRVLELQTLIEVKAAANRPKDRAALPALIALQRRLAAGPRSDEG